MPGRGPAPRDPASTRQPGRHKVTTICTADIVGVPALPDETSYSTETVEWYRTWARSPQAARFAATDWQRLHMLAPLVEQFFAEPSTKAFTEIRLNESLLGATVVDRQRLRWELEPATPSPTPPAVGRSRYGHLRITDDSA